MLSKTSFGAGLGTVQLFGQPVKTVVLLGILAIVALTALWLLLFAAFRMWTRPADVRPLPANQDLPGDEPPAVVSLLAGRWTLNEDAAESTLIDLAARGYLEFRQPGNDPTQTTVHLRQTSSSPKNPADQLTSYEQMVLEHVRSEARADVVPVTALTFRDDAAAASWTKRLHSAVVDDARARGLTRRRISPAMVTFLSLAAVLPAGALSLLIAVESDPKGWGVGLLFWGGLSGLAGRPLGERDTPAGREAAARWLGLRAFLHNDQAFAELPPAAVAVWDRYLSYGDALGVTRVCQALLDLGMGDRKRVWSSYGGQWHRVRVRYPKVWARYGQTPLQLVLRALASLALGVVVLKLFGFIFDRDTSGAERLAVILPLIGVYLVVRGIYRIARTAVDGVAPRTVSGEVLWVQLWRQTEAKENKPSVPLVHYFAVDDGAGERTTAWALPSEWSARSRPGDGVTMAVRPWSRRVTELTVNSSRAEQLAKLSQAAGPAPQSSPPASTPAGPRSAFPGLPGLAGLDAAVPALDAVPLPGALAAPVAAAVVATATTPAAGAVSQPLLSDADVSSFLGEPVASDNLARVSLGPFTLVTFASVAAGHQHPRLVLAVAHGRAVQLVMRAIRRGTELPGIGDEAWSGSGWVAGRRGDTLVRLTLDQSAPQGRERLPELLSTALARVSPS